MNLPDFKDISSASRQVATYSAMNPILWKTVICSPVAMICSTLAVEPLNYMLFGLAALPILVGSWGFIHFAYKSPDRLQSEGHIEHMQVLSRIGDNRTNKQITIESNRLPEQNSDEEG